MLQRAASNAYSWWWASHVRTKQSKWLDNHLQDMEHRVKCMLLLLGEEADSFSKRAEMYYKRRPEVITQVEEVYRAYRALADRYDIMSGELHKANHTIATAFPDQVQYAMLEEEDDNIPKVFTPVDPRKIHKSTIDGLMKKKKEGHPRTMLGAKNNPDPTNKENAREEISRLQKEILVMQTEKEFIKSSYESGIAKYWDLEKEINDMQEQVCHFQDKFDESAVIEDDEARALMTTTALKSCEDTIVKLQEQRKASTIQAVGELERVKVYRDKLKSIMKEHGQSLLESPKFSHKSMRKNHGAETENVYHAKLSEFEMQTIVDKIKEHFERDCNISMVEITEQIDELVNKVVDLELMVSSQTSQMDRLCRENNELDNSLQSLEEENTTLATGSGELNEKLRKVEEDLTRVQSLESSFHKDEVTIHSNFTETINRFSDISEMLLSPVCKHQVASTHTLADEEETPSRCKSDTREEGPEDTNAGVFVDPSYEPHTDKNHEGKLEQADGDDTNETHKVASTDASLDGTMSSAESDIGQDKGSRERGSLARLRHISYDNLGGHDEQEEMGKQGSTSFPVDGASDIDKLQERLICGLEDKEKVLLAEYTSLLEDYKDTKRKLTEVEKRNHEFIHEIRSLRELLNVAGAGENKERSSSSNCSGNIRRGHRRTPSYSLLHHRKQSLSSISRLIRMGSTIQEGNETEESSDDIRLPASTEVVSPMEEKFRRDIDTLLEENLELWMKFSSSLQRVQEFQGKYEDMQSVITMKQEAACSSSSKKETETAPSPAEKQLRALKTEVQVWLEQNAMLRGELQCRFTSLCDIQEEITAAVEMEREGGRLTAYQAAKFQGEVLNMQQENNKVSDELQVGLDHIKGLQAEIEKALAEKLHHRALSPTLEHKDIKAGLARIPSKSRVPLQSFLFPSKNKKTSLFARVTPVLALQKQQAELRFLAKLPR